MRADYILNLAGMVLSEVENEIKRYGKVLRKLFDGIKSHTKRREQLLDVKAQLLYQRKLLDKAIDSLDNILKSDEIDANTYAETCDSIYVYFTEQTARSYLVFLSMTEVQAEAQQVNLKIRDLQIYYSFAIRETLDKCVETYNSKEASNVLKFHSTFYLRKEHSDKESFLRELQRVYLVKLSDSLYENELKNRINRTKEKSAATEAFKTLLAHYLIEWREENGYTKKALSDKCNIERTTISNLESMRQLASTDKIIKILQSTGAQLVIIPATRSWFSEDTETK